MHRGTIDSLVMIFGATAFCHRFSPGYLPRSRAGMEDALISLSLFLEIPDINQRCDVPICFVGNGRLQPT